MQIKRFPLLRMSIREFADKHELVMEVHERYSGVSPTKFYAHFTNSEIQDGTMLVSEFGMGPTEDAAITAYAKTISGKRLVLNSFRSTRKEIQVPTLREA